MTLLFYISFITCTKITLSEIFVSDSIEVDNFKERNAENWA
jgi:hypothetical protein